MLLTLSTTFEPATDLGYLLHKHPGRVHVFPQSFGSATVFFPEATPETCTAALLLEVDPVRLARKSPGQDQQPPEHYVNDRPYAAASYLAVAMGGVFRSALGGRCPDRPELPALPIPLRAQVSVVSCRGGEPLLRELFEPLGYAVEAQRLPLDPNFPQWGDSPYFRLRLAATCRVADLLSHLLVLLPALDATKHYWVGPAEVEKLLHRGGDWLARHPSREKIARRYLDHRRSLVRAALGRLVVEDEADDDADPDESPAAALQEETLETRVSLQTLRLRAVTEALLAGGAHSVADLGCGEGRLLAALVGHRQFRRLVGMDVSLRSLERAHDRLKLDRLPPTQRERIGLLHGSLVYDDERLHGFDAATVVEVIEHLDPHRLRTFAEVLFGRLRPGLVVITTPNVEYNVKFQGLAPGELRHGDHRFEWTRDEFAAWTHEQASAHGYTVSLHAIGETDETVGAPTQMAVFELAGTAAPGDPQPPTEASP